MNIENVKAAIAGMKLVAAKEVEFNRNMVCMQYWQDLPELGVAASTLEHLTAGVHGEHECGTAACLAGHMTLMPHFKALGLVVGEWGGLPILGRSSGTSAIASVLEIDYWAACQICAVTQSSEGFSACYGKFVNEVSSTDVIARLEHLLETGEVKMAWAEGL
ncbi:hypothetical protein [Methylotenera sp.]|uniref:hypothetical protein n=1 Tax=Methylotenera sp. TaxID=2051956 RepID=UPI00248A463D|nr:hypothetical protein [Methylotenera sp.]MDI1362536.1 hypothetical protein [Methylotenera sp.]